ncbi:MAG: GWxTD domain-containing protein [bacterium]
MKSLICWVICGVVLWKLFADVTPSVAQGLDSGKGIIFQQSPISSSIVEPEKSHLTLIPSIGIGPYSGFRSDGTFGTIIQPDIAMEFLAEPGGGIHYLFGGHLGISDPFTTGITFGLRHPLTSSLPDKIQLFADWGILVFENTSLTGKLKYGLRTVLGVKSTFPIPVEYRISAEWRGTGSDSVDDYRTRTLWWVGLEVGFPLSLFREVKQFSRKDSLRASLPYVATADEMSEFTSLSSNYDIDTWLDRFWRLRDLTPETKLNEARIEFDRRVELANKLYSTSTTLGIQSDPGRVLAIYGAPDVRDEDHSVYDQSDRYMVFVYSGRLKDVAFGSFLFRKSTSQILWQQQYSNIPGELSGVIPDGIPVRFYKWLQ